MGNVGFEDDGYDVLEEQKPSSISTPTLWDIIPKTGLYLGLDISDTSTGITYIENGERITANATLDEKSGVFREVLLRRALKEDLRTLIEGKDFDVIVIEDAFVGYNPDTVRLLFALNTAIDEMILDGICSCKKFVRVNNKQWKSWLNVLDPSGVSKGLNDKEKIRVCLSFIGIEEYGEGYQDRLDSTGLLVGYFLQGQKSEVHGGLDKVKKVRFSDIEASYDVDTGYLFFGRDDLDTSKIVFTDVKKFNKKKIVDMLSADPSKIYVTESEILLGNLGDELGLDLIDGGGYFAFWVNPKKLKRYLRSDSDGEA